MKRVPMPGASRPTGSPPSIGPGPASRSPLGEWLNDRQLSFIVLLAVTAASLYLAYIIFRPFLASLFLSFVLTVAFLPLHHWASRHVRNNSVAAGLTTAVVVLFILVPSIFLSRKLLAEATSLYGLLSRQWSSSGALRRLPDSLFRMAADAGISRGRLSGEIATRAQELGAWAVGLAGWAASMNWRPSFARASSTTSTACSPSVSPRAFSLDSASGLRAFPPHRSGGCWR